eukprot:3220803-Amphidinium_carterae.1
MGRRSTGFLSPNPVAVQIQDGSRMVNFFSEGAIAGEYATCTVTGIFLGHYLQPNGKWKGMPLYIFHGLERWEFFVKGIPLPSCRGERFLL